MYQIAQRGGPNLEQHFPFLRHRVRGLAVAGRSGKVFYHRSVHD